MSITTTRSIAAPAAGVHDLLIDVDAWTLWSPHVVSVEPPHGRVTTGWCGRVRPFFAPATTMIVTEVRPDAGYSWHTRALGHRLDYDLRLVPQGEQSCLLTISATLSGRVASVMERLVSGLSAFGQRRRAARLAVLAQGWRRR